MTTISAEEIEKKILSGETKLQDIIVEGRMDLHDATIEGHLSLENVTIAGNPSALDLSNATIKGILFFGKNVIIDLLDLGGITIEDDLVILSKSIGSIRVDSNQAEFIHWSAPTIPLIIAK